MCSKSTPSYKVVDSAARSDGSELEGINPRPESISLQHGALVNAVAFSVDGLASASNDGSVRFWRADARSAFCDPIPPCFLHESPVRDIAATKDGSFVASGSDNGTVLLWRLPMVDNAPEARVSYVLRGAGHVSGLLFSPDGSRLGVTTREMSVYVLNVPTGELACEFRGHLHALQCRPAFTPHATYILSGSASGTLGVWNIRQRANVAMLRCHTDTIFAIDVAPDGSRFVSGSADHTLYLGYFERGLVKPATASPLVGHSGAIYTVEFSQQGGFFASGSEDGTVRLWSNVAGESIAVYQQQSDIVSNICISLDGRILASASHNGSVRLWDTRMHKPIGKPLLGHTQSVRSVAFSPSGNVLASASLDRTVRVWRLRRDDERGGDFGHEGAEQPAKIIVDYPSRSNSPSGMMYVKGEGHPAGGSTMYTSNQAIQNWASGSAVPPLLQDTGDPLDLSSLSVQLERADGSRLMQVEGRVAIPGKVSPTRSEGRASSKKYSKAERVSPSSRSEELFPPPRTRSSSRGGHDRGRRESTSGKDPSTPLPRESSRPDETRGASGPSHPWDAKPSTMPEQTLSAGTTDFADSRSHVRQSISSFWGTMKSRQLWLGSSLAPSPTPQTEETAESRKRVGKAVASVLGKTGLDIAHQALVIGVDLLQLAPIPALSIAGHILLDIWDAFEQIQTNRSACERLATRCADILLSIREEVANAGDGVFTELEEPIASLNESFDKIHELIKQQTQLPFLKRYLGRDKILQDIEACHSDLNDARDKFGLSIQIRTLKLQSAAAVRLLSIDNNLQAGNEIKQLVARVEASLKEQDIQDLKQDDTRLRRLMREAIQANDDVAMLDLLQIPRSEMLEAMRVLQRVLDQSDREYPTKMGAPRRSEASSSVPPRRRKSSTSKRPPASRRRHPVAAKGDDLDRRFMQTGVEALRRLSAKAGAEVDLPNWTITKYEVDCEQRIGFGAFSDVYKGTWREDTVAIKVLTDAVPQKTFIREVEIWKKLSHLHVLHLFGASSASSDPPWFFVSPYYRRGNVVTYLRNKPDVWLWRLRKMLREVAKGMAYLHRENVLHGDLKAANILVADDLHCVISDFGQSEMKSEVCRLSGIPISRGTLRWQAPELLTGSESRLTPQVDVYAYAICCSEILGKGALPWPLLDDTAVRHVVLDENKRPPLLHCRQALRDIIEPCWDRDPAFRPSFEEMVARLNAFETRNTMTAADSRGKNKQ